MLQVNKAYSSTAPEVEVNDASSSSTAEFLPQAIGILRRQWPVLVVSLIATLVAASLYYLRSTPTYAAVATIVIDTGKFQLFAAPGTLGETSIDSAAALESQLEIIKSEKIALKVINDLHLAEGAEVRPGWWVALFGAPKPLSDFQRTRDALGSFAKHLTVKRRGMALMIEIGFESASPELAAQIANTTADTYVTDQLEAKYEATRLGSAYLEGRVADLRVQAEATQRAVVEYKAKNNIVEAGAGRLGEQQLTEVNTQLGAAKLQTAEAKARLERITAIAKAATEDAAVNASLTGVLTTDTLAKLRAQYAEASSRATDFEQKYGRSHLSVVNLRTQMAQLRTAMFDEVRRLAESYESDYNLAVTREKALASDLAQSIERTEATSRVSVKLHELEGAAQTATALYENFRKRYIESLEQQSFPVPEARVLTRAVPPLEREYKRLLRVLAGIFGVGGALGIGFALYRELGDRVYRTVSQVERRLQVNCIAMIPRVKTRTDQAGSPAEGGDGDAAPELRVPQFPQSPMWYVVNSPLSAYAETMRSIKLAIDLNAMNKSTKVVGITSTLPREGKSTTAASLALTIGQTGAQVILVDCDLRNPTLTRTLAPDATHGFIEVLSGEISLLDALRTDSARSISFLPAVFNSGFSQSTAVMASTAAKMFFDSLRDSFDYVIVDLPPLAPIVDTRATAPLIDSYLFVIEWGQTKIDVVEHALGRAPGICDNLLGVVLNNVDMTRLKNYDERNASFYKNAYYSQYGYID